MPLEWKINEYPKTTSGESTDPRDEGALAFRPVLVGEDDEKALPYPCGRKLDCERVVAYLNAYHRYTSFEEAARRMREDWDTIRETIANNCLAW